MIRNPRRHRRRRAKKRDAFIRRVEREARFGYAGAITRARHRRNPEHSTHTWLWIGAGVLAVMMLGRRHAAATMPPPVAVGPTVNGVPVPIVQVPPAPVGSTTVLPTWAIGLPPAGTPSPTTGAPTPLVLVTVSPGGGQPVAVPLNPPATPNVIPPTVNRPFNPNDPFNTEFGGDYSLPS